jgi:Excalibur calcium-binding domain
MPNLAVLRSARQPLLAIMLIACGTTAAWSAQVQKCVVEGKVIYQADTCPSATPRQRPKVEQLNKERKERQSQSPSAITDKPTSLPGPPAAATAGESKTSSQYRCDGRKYCSQMTSCAEAKYFLSNCPGVQMDGNNDGVPCERQWCR